MNDDGITLILRKHLNQQAFEEEIGMFDTARTRAARSWQARGWASGPKLLVVTLVTGLVLAACGSATSVSTTSASSAATASTTGGAQSGSQNGGPPGGGSGGGSAQYTPTGTYSQSSGSVTKSGTFTSATKDRSGVLVSAGSLTLNGATVTTSGASSSSDESSCYGLNAGVLARGGGTITMSGGSVTTSGDGANGVFAYGTSKITLTGTTIKATGQYAHGIMTSGGGTIVAKDLTVSTSGGSSAPVATDRGGGTITVTGGSYTSSGNNSPGIYSTGNITATGATFLATGSEVVVIEGANNVTLNNASLTANKAGKWGVMIYQSMSGDASGTKGTYTQTGGSLTETASDSPLFYVTNTTGVITLSGVKISNASGTLLKAAAGQWGASGSNGGTSVLTASGQTLTGNVVADKASSVTLTLKSGSSLSGAIDSADMAKSVALTLDASSAWNVTANSHVTSLTGAVISGSTISNIKGNRHTVTYDKNSSANAYLGGKTYTLAGGGTLAPA